MHNGAALQQSDSCFSPSHRLPWIEPDTFLLLREMHHRHANSLTILARILRRELGPSAPRHLHSPQDKCEARIVALAGLHRFLIVGAKSGWIPVQTYLKQLCEALTDAILKPLGTHCEVSSNQAFLPSEHCELLGLIIAELVMNAAKHAFRDRDDGVVRVEFLNTTESWTCMVSDNGVAAPAAPVGVGSSILAMLVDALGAKFVPKSDPRGTSVAVNCPIHAEFCPPMPLQQWS